MNIFKYIWLKVVGYFKPAPLVIGTLDYRNKLNRYVDEIINKSVIKESESKFLQDPSPQIIKEWREEHFKELSEKFPLDLPLKEKDPARWGINEEKPKRPYNRATNQQVARIKVLVGRGKTAKQIAKDVGLPYDNVNYYVKKFGG